MTLHQQLLDATGPLVGTLAKDDVHHAFAARRALRAVVERCAEVVRDASDPMTVESCDELDAVLAGELLRDIARELGIEATDHG